MTPAVVVPLHRILLLSHALGGGVASHVSDLLVLLGATVEVDVLRPAGEGLVRLSTPGQADRVLDATDWPRLSEALRSRGYSRLQVHHVDGFAPEVLGLPAALGTPYDVTLHDYLAYCPRYNLSSPRGGYCGEPEQAACQRCVQSRPHAWGWSIVEWRERLHTFLGAASRLLAPSQFVAQRVNAHYPDLQITVLPHPPRADWLEAPRADFKVAVLGGLSRIKGLEVLRLTAERAREHTLPVTFTLLGSAETPLEEWPDLPVQVRGTYHDPDLPALLALERVDAIWYPGPFPETHCYTLDVAMASGLPILASARGALVERLQAHPGAVLMDADSSADAWLQALLRMAKGSLLAAPADLSAAWPQAEGQAQRRQAYAQTLLAPVLAQPVPVRGDDAQALAAVLTSPKPEPDLTLQALFDYGVSSGHRHARTVLRQRLVELDRDVAVLKMHTERAGIHWSDLLDTAVSVQADLRGRLDAAAAVQADLLGRLDAAANTQANLLGRLDAAATVQSDLLGRLDVAAGAKVELRQQLDASVRAQTELRQQLDAELRAQSELRQQLDAAANVQNDLRQRLESAGHIQAELNVHLRTARGELQAQQSAFEASQQDLRRGQARIIELEQSTSWRVTAPLRSVGALTKKSRQRLGTARRLLVRGIERTPMLLSMLRNEGPRAVARRIRDRLNPPVYQPTPRPMPEMLGLGPLSLPTCPDAKRPRFSIVIPVYEQHQYTFNCLKSLGEHTDLSDVEVIVVDDASPHPVSEALPDIQGVRFVRNPQNLGFIGSCHHGADIARGEMLVMLNNDTQVTAGWLEALHSVFEQRPDAGLVGARLIYPNGTLQEAGGIVWQDGSAWNWGRGDDPDRPIYNYLREADYCSGACLLIRRSDWDALEGFDRAYTPAYYEDTDLAFRIRAAGKRVYYQPQATIVHYEGISSGTDETQGMKRHQVINREVFLKRWLPVLKSHRLNGMEPLREVDRPARGRILIVEACMITPDQDSGSVRMLAMLELLVEQGFKVSFVADNLECRQPYVGQLQRIGVEVWFSPYIQSVAELLEQRGKLYDTIMFCRHYIAAPYMGRIREWAPQATIVFDTVDLHYLREQRLAELENSESLMAISRKTREQELGVIRQCDITVVTSPVEVEVLATETPGAQIRVVSNIHEVRPGGPGYAEREGLLFIGGFRHPPNIDAVEWFVGEVWPLLRPRLPELTFTVVGSHMPPAIKALEGDGIIVHGYVEDVDPLIDSARVSLAPLRYGAGVKGKINQAMAYGLPVVATVVAAEGMSLRAGVDLLVADSPQAFADEIVRLYQDESLWNTLAANGRANIEQYFSRATAAKALAAMVVPR
ncbi:glycosyltransferase [Curvibacter sp. RS43]|uniref:glycosyltransferase n=1 Tax=Curvibacter microcysteis TaxID=3026419 RepID=UPI00235DF0E6|nr:glycosyltransferase [Curvibacter sp. RS43]MDD0812152.1 glycosyltransferase [Curvibacter sp. RS43]